LHSGLRAEELCKLKPHHVKLGKRSGHLKAYGKRGKYREAPINVTGREALAEWMRGCRVKTARPGCCLLARARMAATARRKASQ
jgi:site-specific recombinase XerC